MLMMPWKFFILPTIQILVIAGFLLGGWFTFLGLVVFLTMSLGFDFVEDRSGVDEMTDLGTPGRILVYVICALQFALIAIGISVAMTSDTWVQTIGVAMTFGPILAVGCGNPGHELAHSKRWYDHEIARALFAVCLHPSVLIDHVYRHHVTVGTPGDPLTARRGERFGAYMMRSVPAQHSGPWQFERERLARKGLSHWSWRNRAIRGYAMSAAYLVLVTALFGPTVLPVVVLPALYAIRGMEAFNYMAHYGVMRVPGTPCGYRHSWNTRFTISSGFTLNLTSHSHHHMAPSQPYWALNAEGDMPLLPFGPALNSILVGLPGVWLRLMTPRLEYWDRNFATDEELALLASGSEAFVPVRSDASSHVRRSRAKQGPDHSTP